MIYRDDCLAGRCVLVTGASSGLGRAAAIGMASVGAKVILCGRDETRLGETLSQLPREGHGTVVASLTDADETSELVRSVAKQYGPLSGIYHAAGVSLTLPLRMTKQSHIDEVFGPSVHASFGITRAAGQKNVMAPGSSIVIMSSVSANRGHPGMMVYGGAKAAVHGLIKSAALELASRRIRINGIISGAVLTEMYIRHADTMGPDWIPSVGKRQPLGLGDPEDMTAAVIFLISDASKWITGTLMTVDGGYTAQGFVSQ
jgi:NAD(P)-dependent dehydrogenase (short-subunit alcohol dehydrogenase family)